MQPINFSKPRWGGGGRNMKRIGLTASEEKSFENVDRWTDDGQTDDGYLHIL